MCVMSCVLVAVIPSSRKAKPVNPGTSTGAGSGTGTGTCTGTSTSDTWFKESQTLVNVLVRWYRVLVLVLVLV
jgi:hypothetical protein